MIIKVLNCPEDELLNVMKIAELLKDKCKISSGLVSLNFKELDKVKMDLDNWIKNY